MTYSICPKNKTPKTRRSFGFLNLHVEIFWHAGRETWAAEAYSEKYGEGQIWSVVFSPKRMKLPGLLRLDIAKQRNHKIQEVHDRISNTKWESADGQTKGGTLICGAGDSR